jgi:hypothetical protein
MDESNRKKCEFKCDRYSHKAWMSPPIDVTTFTDRAGRAIDAAIWICVTDILGIAHLRVESVRGRTEAADELSKL